MSEKNTPPEKPARNFLLVDERFMSAEAREILWAHDDSPPKSRGQLERDLGDILMARALLEPAVRSAVTIQPFDELLDVNALVDQLRVEVSKVAAGDMGRPEAMLVSQAHTLDALFCSLARRGQKNMELHNPENAERYLRLAFRAQAQTVRTLEALGELKNPRAVAFVKQANIAHNQQVNNGAAEAPRAQENGNRPNELLEHTHGNPLDCATAAAAGRADSDLAALAALDRPADC